MVLDAGYGSYQYEHELLGAAGYGLDTAKENLDRGAKIAFAQGSAGMFVRGTEVDGAFLDAVPSIRAIVRYGIGYDNVDLGAASARGIKVSNVQGYANHSVSDHALALILACLRGLLPGVRGVIERFGKPPITHMPELRDMTLGIVGLGRIGGALSGKAQGLFKRVLACDPYAPVERFAERGATRADLDTLLRESDVITLHCNLTPETTRLIGRDAFAKMARNPILINTARGPVVDEAALLEALNEGRLHAAGLDVYWDEPPDFRQEPLLYHPNVIATGHYAWYSETASAELQRRAAHNMLTMLEGGIPEDCLNP